jgi:hypothetical protein
MGCLNSKDRLVDVAPPPSGRGQQKPNITTPILRQALEAMASYVIAQRRDLTVMVVGGAVSTMRLDLRTSTKDVNFFGGHLSSSEMELLQQASEYARRKIRVPNLDSAWFNNRAMIFVNQEAQQRLYDEAVQQNVVVFQKLGLKLLAAPWEYQFWAKLCRISGGANIPYDEVDAAAYLHEHLRTEHMVDISINQIGQMLERYGFQNKDGIRLPEAYRAINRAYVAKYRTAPPILNQALR